MRRSKDAENGRVTTDKGEVLQADLIVAADGVHSAAVKHVLGDDVVQVGDTGWACMRWLVPTEELLSDPETAHLVQDSVTRYFTAAEGAAGFVWYTCRKCAPPPLSSSRRASGNLLTGSFSLLATRCRTACISLVNLIPHMSEKVWMGRSSFYRY